jgi:hypothetical protein
MRSRVGLALGVVLLLAGACAHQDSQTELPNSPAPDPVVPEPALGAMVATIDGEAWQSTVKRLASGPGDSDRFFLLGQADHKAILIDFPGLLPRTGTYELADGGAEGRAALLLTVPEGQRNYYTSLRHKGSATITRVDSVSVAGSFNFQASTDAVGAPVYDIRSGAFNVPLGASSASAATSPASGAARLP